ncbi:MULTISPECIES: S8 family peptidase [Frankia]|nr:MULTISPECIES: S8 family peptidase [Frankia]
MRNSLFRFAAIGGLITAVVGAQTAAMNAAFAAPPDPAGQYIVVLKPTAQPNAPAPAVGRARGIGVRVDREFRQSVNGYVARLNTQQLNTVRADPDVDYVEADKVVHADITQRRPDWGLDRVDQRERPLDHKYVYDSTGARVTAYIVDTGIRTSHKDFGGRASSGFSSIDDGHGTDDCNGHGTHVAGTVGGSTYGIAKSVRLVAVRVLDCDGFGTVSGVIAGIDWITAHHASPAVVNVSLEGDASRALDSAVRQSINAGLTYSVSAGNGGSDACDFSPARLPRAITVGATTTEDSRDTSYSNFGTCVDLFAPGTDVTSDWSASDTATNTISGTSMAAPHVTGAAALYLETHPDAGPDRVRTALVTAAVPGVLTNVGNGSPNALLYSRGTAR